MNMTATILIENVTKQYGINNLLAIKDVSLHITPGEFCTIIGPSGSGKTTIINLIAGFVLPTAGQILVNNVRVLRPGPDRVVVSQDYSLFPWKSVQDNVEFGLKARGLSRRERQLTAWRYLELVDLAEFAHRYPLELSGGMRQRVALARALAIEPACILMDEPLAALDIQMRQSLQDELLNIWGQARQTVLLATHDLEEALYLSDRVLVLTPRPGQVRAEIQVPFERPRLPQLRLSQAFQELKAKVACYLEPISKPHTCANR